ncbi:hypothetical protein EDB83DRAFT_2559359 [Lactarius deliciosus]|nr:hypothetical protein EDB83DRAFT_2559359 [Lactarius deliciosus]
MTTMSTLHHMGVRHRVMAHKIHHNATLRKIPLQSTSIQYSAQVPPRPIGSDDDTSPERLQSQPPCADNNGDDRRRWDVAGHNDGPLTYSTVQLPEEPHARLVLTMIICVGRKLGMVTEILIQMPPMCEKWLLGIYRYETCCKGKGGQGQAGARVGKGGRRRRRQARARAGKGDSG